MVANRFSASSTFSYALHRVLETSVSPCQVAVSALVVAGEGTVAGSVVLCSPAIGPHLSSAPPPPLLEPGTAECFALPLSSSLDTRHTQTSTSHNPDTTVSLQSLDTSLDVTVSTVSTVSSHSLLTQPRRSLVAGGDGGGGAAAAAVLLPPGRGQHGPGARPLYNRQGGGLCRLVSLLILSSGMS